MDAYKAFFKEMSEKLCVGIIIIRKYDYVKDHLIR